MLFAAYEDASASTDARKLYIIMAAPPSRVQWELEGQACVHLLLFSKFFSSTSQGKLDRKLEEPGNWEDHQFKPEDSRHGAWHAYSLGLSTFPQKPV